jgi:PQQ enzyme repeat
VLALDEKTGNVVWRKQVESHPSGKVTGSISGHGNRIYVPVGTRKKIGHGPTQTFMQIRLCPARSILAARPAGVSLPWIYVPEISFGKHIP